MESYSPQEEPPVHSNGLMNNKIETHVFTVGALAVSSVRRHRRVDDAFPVVLLQNTQRNQAICSLMSEVLLRRVGNKYSGRRVGTRRIREPLLHLRDQGGVSLNWNLPQVLELSSINVPTVFVVHSVTTPSSISRMDSICDIIAQRGLVAVELALCDDGISTRDIVK